MREADYLRVTALTTLRDVQALMQRVPYSSLTAKGKQDADTIADRLAHLIWTLERRTKTEAEADESEPER